MFLISIVISIIIGVFLGILVYHNRKLSEITINFFNVMETIPTLALLVLLIPFFGIGTRPTIVASVIYSILPIMRNTIVGLRSIPNYLLEVALSLGLSNRDILVKIRIPLSLPLIIAGIRIAVVFTMGVVTLGGLIAAGGLGAPIQTGIHLYDKNIILIAGIWVGILAIMFDSLFSVVEKLLKKRYELWLA